MSHVFAYNVNRFKTSAKCIEVQMQQYVKVHDIDITLVSYYIQITQELQHVGIGTRLNSHSILKNIDTSTISLRVKYVTVCSAATIASYTPPGPCYLSAPLLALPPTR